MVHCGGLRSFDRNNSDQSGSLKWIRMNGFYDIGVDLSIIRMSNAWRTIFFIIIILDIDLR